MRYAGFWVRLMAHNIDLTILLPVFYGFSFFISNNRLLYLSCFLLALVYEIVFIQSKWSATPGKRLVKIKVTSSGSESLSLPKIVGRTLIKCISASTLLIGYLFVILDPKKRSMHDFIVGSMVIFRDEG